MINNDSVVTAYDEHLTLVEWLQKVEALLKNGGLKEVALNDKGNGSQYNKALFSLTLTFNDGTKIESNDMALKSVNEALNNLNGDINTNAHRIDDLEEQVDNKTIPLFGKYSILVPEDSAEANILPCTPSDNGKVLSVVNGEAQWASAGGGGGGVGIIDISSTWSAITPTDFQSLKFKSYLVGNMIYIEIKAIFQERPVSSKALFQNTTYIIPEDVALPFFDGIDAKRIIGGGDKKLYVANPVDDYRLYLSGWFTIEA